MAGITITTLFGENGVINKAQKAKEETERTVIEEQEGLNKTKEDMENVIKGTVQLMVRYQVRIIHTYQKDLSQ